MAVLQSIAINHIKYELQIASSLLTKLCTDKTNEQESCQTYGKWDRENRSEWGRKSQWEIDKASESNFRAYAEIENTTVKKLGNQKLKSHSKRKMIFVTFSHRLVPIFWSHRSTLSCAPLLKWIWILTWHILQGCNKNNLTTRFISAFFVSPSLSLSLSSLFCLCCSLLHEIYEVISDWIWIHFLGKIGQWFAYQLSSKMKSKIGTIITLSKKRITKQIHVHFIINN